MYAGTTFRTKSGLIIGVHQRIDRVARHRIRSYLPKTINFPTTKEILHFEGLNGPDGIKRKSPSKDEPWHFIDPYDPNDRSLIIMVNDHIYNLTQALKSNNHERASFEAAWMSHAITDGLTPAHHYPLEEKLAELRGGEGLETRNTKFSKVVLPGINRRHRLKNNWEYWGAKGVMTTHLGFELGVAMAIGTHKFDKIILTEEDIIRLKNVGFETMFLQTIKEVADLDMYHEFTRTGWTSHLANEVRDILIPKIVRVVCLGWYEAIEKATN